MTERPTYILDANVLIEAARRYYAFDLAPRFWETLAQYGRRGVIASIDRVREELKKGKDQLAAWIDSDFTGAFLSTDDEEVLVTYSNVMQWVQNQPQFHEAAKVEFARGADGWLVAYSKAKQCVLVTQEVSAPEAKEQGATSKRLCGP